jgi:hypothetical protein
MRRHLPVQILTYILLIAMVFGFAAYRSALKRNAGNEICRIKVKEHEVIKPKASFSLWQSLSRQLITITR